jgi:Tfp pilus assembly protein FimT
MGFTRSPSARGAALVDLVFTCGIVAVIAGIAIPTIHAARDRDTTRMAARFLANRLHAARYESLKRNACVAIRFDPVDVGRFVVYVDGDGDGVLQSDIDGGIDVALGPESRLSDVFAAATLAILRDIPDPDGSGTLIANSDPIRLGSSNFLSFSPIGSATSGTIYLAGAGGAQAAVRVMGATGRMRVLLLDVGTRTWREE